MDKQYFLHRISHESNVSYALAEKGYLTLGWSKFSDTDILEAAREEGYPRFNSITSEKGEGKSRSRWCMWYFAQIRKGDVIVVPLFSGKFAVFEACLQAQSLKELEYKDELQAIKGHWNNSEFVWENGKLINKDTHETIDLGFFVKVKRLTDNISRSYIGGPLTSRMKIRNTTTNITALGGEVERAVKAAKDGKPLTLYYEIIGELVANIKAAIQKNIDDRKFVKIIKWYLEKCGAEKVWIPAKNESKEDGADADVIAEFTCLKYIVYVQAKWYKGETNQWAVHQIDSYKEQKCDGDLDYTYATWVISSSDSFTEQAKEDADKRGVRLINGDEFAKMLIDIGIKDIDSAYFNDTEIANGGNNGIL